MSKKVLDIVSPGVVTGDDVQKLLTHAKQEGFALPAVNVVGTDSVNAVMEAAQKVNSPVIIQFSVSMPEKVCPMTDKNLLSSVRSQAPGIFIYWLKHMLFRS